MKYQKIVHFFLVLILDLARTHYLGFHGSHKTFEVSDLLRSQKPVGRVQRCSARETFGTTTVCQKLYSDTRQVVDTGWQNLTAFRREQKWQWKFSSSAYLQSLRQMRCFCAL